MRESRVKLLLLWVAASDGSLDDSELEFVESKLPDTGESLKLEDFLAVIRKQDLVLLGESVKSVAAESRARRSAFLETAITLSLADHEFADVENHILRFYADALHLGLEVLDQRFQKVAGRGLPSPAGSAEASADELTHATLKTIGALRHQLELDPESSWFAQNYPDYVVKKIFTGSVHEPAAVSSAVRPKKSRKRLVKSSKTNYIIFFLIVLILIIFAYVINQF